MINSKKDVVGLFEEPTTYKHDFCVYPNSPPSKPPHVGSSRVQNFLTHEKLIFEEKKIVHIRILQAQRLETLEFLSH